MTDDLLVMLSACGFLGLLDPRLGWLVLMMCSMGKFFGR